MLVCAAARMLIFVVTLAPRAVLTDGLKRCHLPLHAEKSSQRVAFFGHCDLSSSCCFTPIGVNSSPSLGGRPLLRLLVFNGLVRSKGPSSRTRLHDAPNLHFPNDAQTTNLARRVLCRRGLWRANRGRAIRIQRGPIWTLVQINRHKVRTFGVAPRMGCEETRDNLVA